MDKTQLIKALKQLKDNSPKRNFKQSIEINIILKDMDLKKNPVNTFVNLHHSKGKKCSVCALVGPELLSQAKEVCDEAISVDDFSKYKEKAVCKRLATKYDYFIAQATIMPKIAATFGRVFGPKGKMPNPKAGCVVPPNANLKPLYEKLQKMIKLQTKTDLMIQCAVATEDMPEEEVVDNILTIYNDLTHALPKHQLNVRSILLKLSMSPPVLVGAKEKDKKTESKEDKKNDSKKEKAVKSNKKKAEKAPESQKPEVSEGLETKSQSKKKPEPAKEKKVPKEKVEKEPKK